MGKVEKSNPEELGHELKTDYKHMTDQPPASEDPMNVEVCVQICEFQLETKKEVT